MPRTGLATMAGEAPADSSWAPARASSRTRARSAGERGEVEVAVESSFDKEDRGKTLSVKGGKLGFISDNGFQEATNFIVDIGAQVYSERYRIKGM